MRAALGAAGVLALLAVAGCSSSHSGGSTTKLPAYEGGFTVTQGKTSLMPSFGAADFVSATGTGCTISWMTEHPLSSSHQLSLEVGKSASLAAFRPATVTLVSVTPTSCSFTEKLPAALIAG